MAKNLFQGISVNLIKTNDKCNKVTSEPFAVYMIFGVHLVVQYANGWNIYGNALCLETKVKDPISDYINSKHFE